MLHNPWRQFLDLIPTAPLLIGTVTGEQGSEWRVQLLSGETIRARGGAQINQRVFVRDGVIEGAAPDLPVVHLEV